MAGTNPLYVTIGAVLISALFSLCIVLYHLYVVPGRQRPAPRATEDQAGPGARQERRLRRSMSSRSAGGKS